MNTTDSDRSHGRLLQSLIIAVVAGLVASAASYLLVRHGLTGALENRLESLQTERNLFALERKIHDYARFLEHVFEAEASRAEALVELQLLYLNLSAENDELRIGSEILLPQAHSYAKKFSAFTTQLNRLNAEAMLLARVFRPAIGESFNRVNGRIARLKTDGRVFDFFPPDPGAVIMPLRQAAKGDLKALETLEKFLETYLKDVRERTILVANLYWDAVKAMEDELNAELANE